MKSQKESLRLEEAGLTGDVLDSAISSFILEVNFLPPLYVDDTQFNGVLYILWGRIDLYHMPVNAEIRALFTSKDPNLINPYDIYSYLLAWSQKKTHSMLCLQNIHIIIINTVWFNTIMINGFLGGSQAC